MPVRRSRSAAARALIATAFVVAVAACTPGATPAPSSSTVAASTAPAATAAPCPKSGYSVIFRSAGVWPFDARRAWSMIHDEPYLPGIPSFFPTRPSASAIPLLALANTIDGNFA